MAASRASDTAHTKAGIRYRPRGCTPMLQDSCGIVFQAGRADETSPLRGLTMLTSLATMKTRNDDHFILNIPVKIPVLEYANRADRRILSLSAGRQRSCSTLSFAALSRSLRP